MFDFHTRHQWSRCLRGLHKPWRGRETHGFCISTDFTQAPVFWVEYFHLHLACEMKIIRGLCDREKEGEAGSESNREWEERGECGWRVGGKKEALTKEKRVCCREERQVKMRLPSCLVFVSGSVPQVSLLLILRCVGIRGCTGGLSSSGLLLVLLNNRALHNSPSSATSPPIHTSRLCSASFSCTQLRTQKRAHTFMCAQCSLAGFYP